jgi:hypothetical protein
VLGYHYAQAGDTEKAVVYLRRAGERAATQGAPVEALEALKQAWDLIPQTDHAERTGLSVRIGTMYDRQGKNQTAAQWRLPFVRSASSPATEEIMKRRRNIVRRAARCTSKWTTGWVSIRVSTVSRSSDWGKGPSRMQPNIFEERSHFPGKSGIGMRWESG